MAGSKNDARYASSGLERSTANVYCTRSFVPMLMNSVSTANSSAMTAADGTSTIMPSGISRARGWPAASTSTSACSNSPPPLGEPPQRRDHRHNDAHFAVHRGADHGAELGQKNVLAREAEPHRA